MFGKLLKQEFKEMGSVILIGSLVLLGISAFNVAATMIHNDLFTIFYTVFAFATLLLGTGCMTACLVLLGVRYHNTMFGKQAYLVRLIPAKTETIYGAKFLAALLVYLLVLILGLFCFISAAIGLVGTVVGGIAQEDADFRQILQDFGNWVSENETDVRWKEVWFQLGCFLLYGVGLLLSAVSMVFFSVTLANAGNLQKNNLLFAVLFYLGISFAFSILFGVMGSFPVEVSVYDLLITSRDNMYYTGNAAANPLVQLLIYGSFFGFFFGGKYLAKKKCDVK